MNHACAEGRVLEWSRRQFLQVTGGIIVGLGLGTLDGGRGRALAAEPSRAPRHASDGDRTLVIIYLGGGNDGLNTIAPLGAGRYHDLRPTLGINETDALPLNTTLGFHPDLSGIKALYDAGKVTIIQGVGYPNPDRSHFRSFDIWATAQHKGVSPVGWLGRLLDLTGGSQANPLRAIAVSPAVPKPLLGSTAAAVAIDSLENFQIKGSPQAVRAVRSMYRLGDGPLAVVRGRGTTAAEAAEAVQRLAAGYSPGVEYPEQNGLARNLQLIVRLLAGGSGAQVVHTTLGGFDEHANEKAGHDRLMGVFDQAVSAYQADLEANRLADRVMTLVYSEFGRRAGENGSGGTDHGAAGPCFLIGTRVRGGVYGEHPSLTDLVDGDLRYGIDFRSVYATLLESWLDGPADEVLGERYERLNVL